MFKKILRWSLVLGLGLFIVIQAVPYGRSHANPSVETEPAWDNSQTRALAKRACFDCHSNETVWPWYSNLAPMSWLVQNDVDKGRSKLNFSEWHLPQEEAEEAAEQVQKGKMPLWFYVPLHPSAKLSAEEKQALIRGLQTTMGGSERQERKESKTSFEKEEEEAEP